MSDKTEKPETPQSPEEREISASTESAVNLESAENPEAPETGEPAQPEDLEEPEVAEHHPAKQSSGSNLAFLATILAVAAGGGAIYLWQQQQAMTRTTQTLQQRIASLNNVVEQQHSSQLQRLDTLAKHRHQDTEEQITRVETQLRDLRGRIGQERREWAVAEVDYLLRVAEYRLNLEHDPVTALAALREARNRLALQDLDVYRPVLRQIDIDISDISDISLPNRNQIAAELSALSVAVENMPTTIGEQTTKSEPAPAPVQAEQPAASEESGWRRIMGKIWGDVRELVTIRHEGVVPKPLLEPSQQYFLKQNLQLKLEAARLALLANNGRAYRDSLYEAGNWLQHYFNTSATSVREAQATVERLAKIELQPALPTIGRSRELLQQAAMQLPLRQQTLPETITPGQSVPKAAPSKPAAKTPLSKQAKPAPAKDKQSPTADKGATETPAESGEAAPAAEQQAEPAQPTEETAKDAPAPPQGNGQ